MTDLILRSNVRRDNMHAMFRDHVSVIGGTSVRRGCRGVLLCVEAARGARDAVRHGGQLLADGRRRAVRAVFRDPLRPDRRAQRLAPRQPRRAGRAGDLESRLHAVQHVRRT